MTGFAKITDVSAGTALVADGGFTCLRDGEAVTARPDEDGLLYVLCDDGRHYLSGQIDGDVYTGLSILSQPNR